MRKKTIRDRFAKKYIVDPACGCWIWAGKSRSVRGYPVMIRRGKTILAHKWAWERKNGEIPEGHVLVHRCHNGWECVNPDHMTLAKDRHEAHVVKHAIAEGAYYPNASERRRAIRVVQWLITMYAPLSEELHVLLRKIERYDQRRPRAWKVSDFAINMDAALDVVSEEISEQALQSL